MTSNGNDAGTRRVGQQGAHRTPRKSSVISRGIVVGGAAVCIGMAFDAAIPTAEALSIVLPSRDQDGNASATQINILEGNIFNPQFAMGGDNVSNNNLIGNAIIGYANDVIAKVIPGSFDRPLVIGGAAGAGNTTQINILSFNVFNPQVAISGNNVSNNTTVNNVAVGNGNGSTTQATSAGGNALFGSMIGNGNATQLAFASGNIFNPQWSLGGQNISNNLAATNIAAYNGNGSQTGTATGSGTGVFGGMAGNGNVFQGAAFVSNIFNPQFSSGNGNSSNNTATTNDSIGNGNGSTTVGNTTGGGLNIGMTGNGNSTQTAGGSSNIFNDQYNFGIASFGRPTGAVATRQQTSAATADELVIAGQPGSGTSPTTKSRSAASAPRPLRTIVRNVQKTTRAIAAAALGKKPASKPTAGAAAAADSGTNPTGGGDTQGGPSGTSSSNPSGSGS